MEKETWPLVLHISDVDKVLDCSSSSVWTEITTCFNKVVSLFCSQFASLLMAATLRSCWTTCLPTTPMLYGRWRTLTTSSTSPCRSLCPRSSTWWSSSDWDVHVVSIYSSSDLSVVNCLFNRMNGTRSWLPTCGSARCGWMLFSAGRRRTTMALTPSAFPAATYGDLISSFITGWWWGTVSAFRRTQELGCAKFRFWCLDFGCT